MRNKMMARLIASLLFTLCVAAQTAAAPPAEDLLAGPKVEETADSKSEGRMSRDGQRQVDRREQVQPQQWFQALRGLDLDDDQQGQIKALMSEFAAAQKKFESSITKEERAMIRQARESRAAGNMVPEETRMLLQKIEATRPKPELVQQKIWAVLNAQQQEQLKAKLDDIRKQAREQRRQRAARNDQMNPDSATNQEEQRDQMAPPARRKRAPKAPPMQSPD